LIIQKFLEQERTPAWTAVALLIAIAVEILLLAYPFVVPRDGWGIVYILFLDTPTIGIGYFVGFLVGCVASGRGEYPGLAVVMWGLLLWSTTGLATLAFVYVRWTYLWH